VKYLGIVIDQHLRWDLQIKNLIIKLRYLISRFKCLRTYLKVPDLSTLYYALVQSHLTYGISGWGGVNNFNISKLSMVQKWIIKVIYNKNKRYSTTQLFKECQFLNLRQLFCQRIAIRILNGKEQIDFYQHPHKTRSVTNQKSNTRRSNKVIGTKCISSIAPKLFNLIPNEIKKVKKIKKYKTLIKNWIYKSNFQIENLFC